MASFESRQEGHYGKGPKGWRRSDASIAEEVNEALYESYDVDATHIEVSVNEGIVTLKGSVHDRKSKRSAEDCVEYIDGVRDVRNELRLEPLEEKGLFNRDLNKKSNIA